MSQTFLEFIVSQLLVLQCPQAGCKYTVVHSAAGLPKAHRLLVEVTIRWRPTWSRQEEEHAQGHWWRCC